jgi:hypothetical protein
LLIENLPCQSREDYRKWPDPKSDQSPIVAQLAVAGQRHCNAQANAASLREPCPVDHSDMPVYTIGHSTRTIAEFGELLGEPAIQAVVDVRAIPRSRTNPQFNLEVLPGSLAEFGVDYQHIAELGGRRHHPRGAPPSPNTFWRNESFRNYADYAASEAFNVGFTRLLELANARRCAIMCSEAVWWRCHRRIISDYLIAQGIAVLHIMGPHKIDPATLTPGAHKLDDGTLLYRA